MIQHTDFSSRTDSKYIICEDTVDGGINREENLEQCLTCIYKNKNNSLIDGFDFDM